MEPLEPPSKKVKLTFGSSVLPQQGDGDIFCLPPTPSSPSSSSGQEVRSPSLFQPLTPPASQTALEEEEEGEDGTLHEKREEEEEDEVQEYLDFFKQLLDGGGVDGSGLSVSTPLPIHIQAQEEEEERAEAQVNELVNQLFIPEGQGPPPSIEELLERWEEIEEEGGGVFLPGHPEAQSLQNFHVTTNKSTNRISTQEEQDEGEAQSRSPQEEADVMPTKVLGGEEVWSFSQALGVGSNDAVVGQENLSFTWDGLRIPLKLYADACTALKKDGLKAAAEDLFLGLFSSEETLTQTLSGSMGVGEKGKRNGKYSQSEEKRLDPVKILAIQRLLSYMINRGPTPIDSSTCAKDLQGTLLNKREIKKFQKAVYTQKVSQQKQKVESSHRFGVHSSLSRGEMVWAEGPYDAIPNWKWAQIFRDVGLGKNSRTLFRTIFAKTEICNSIAKKCKTPGSFIKFKTEAFYEIIHWMKHNQHAYPYTFPTIVLSPEFVSQIDGGSRAKLHQQIFVVYASEVRSKANQTNPTTPGQKKKTKKKRNRKGR